MALILVVYIHDDEATKLVMSLWLNVLNNHKEKFYDSHVLFAKYTRPNKQANRVFAPEMEASDHYQIN